MGVLSAAALAIGFVHTLYGPDHYVPFVAMSRVGKWSLRKTVLVTFFCGLGHVLSSVILGSIGIALGLVVVNLESVESVRASWAGWAMILFGLTYFIWGVYISIRQRPHRHFGCEHVDLNAHAGHDHSNQDSTSGGHPGCAQTDHFLGKVTVHDGELAIATDGLAQPRLEKIVERPAKWTPWVLFVVFLLGPCEPLIPLLMYPAAEASIWGVVWITSLFAFATLATMISIVVLVFLGADRWRKYGFGSIGGLERYGHAIAGLVVLVCGMLVKFGGF